MFFAYLMLIFLVGPPAVFSAAIHRSNSVAFTSAYITRLLDDSETPQCRRLDTQHQQRPGISPTDCETAADSLCQIVSRHQGGAGHWISIAQPRCTIGFYRPRLEYPKFVECSDVLAGLIERCGQDSRFNAGSVNVAVMPSLWQEGTAVDEKRMRYVMAPWGMFPP